MKSIGKLQNFAKTKVDDVAKSSYVQNVTGKAKNAAKKELDFRKNQADHFYQNSPELNAAKNMHRKQSNYIYKNMYHPIQDAYIDKAEKFQSKLLAAAGSKPKVRYYAKKSNKTFKKMNNDRRLNQIKNQIKEIDNTLESTPAVQQFRDMTSNVGNLNTAYDKAIRDTRKARRGTAGGLLLGAGAAGALKNRDSRDDMNNPYGYL